MPWLQCLHGADACFRHQRLYCQVCADSCLRLACHPATMQKAQKARRLDRMDSHLDLHMLDPKRYELHHETTSWWSVSLRQWHTVGCICIRLLPGRKHFLSGVVAIRGHGSWDGARYWTDDPTREGRQCRIDPAPDHWGSQEEFQDGKHMRLCLDCARAHTIAYLFYEKWPARLDEAWSLSYRRCGARFDHHYG